MVEAEPFFRYVLHDGLARAGRADLVAGQCRDWQVFLDAGETTWPECWVGGTRCHGWSSTPTARPDRPHPRDHPGGTGLSRPSGWRPALGGLGVGTGHGADPARSGDREAADADGTVEVDSPVPVVRAG